MPGATLRQQARDTLGDVPRLTTVGDTTPHDTWRGAREVPCTRSRPGGKINLAPVAEVLARYGIDPAEELARLLAERVPVLDASGRPVLDAEGKPMLRSMLPPGDHGKLAAELLQYTRPKLKATEITVKPPELTDDQIDRRLESLLARRQGAPD